MKSQLTVTPSDVVISSQSDLMTNYSASSPVSPEHISRKRPDLVKSYGAQLWLDPAEKDVQD